MKRSAALFAAVWCLLSIVSAFVMLYFNIEENTKVTQFILLNTLFMVGIGIFFAIYRDKITVLLSNYTSEKEI